MEVRVRAFNIPTERPEQDGTLEWDSTTLVTVELTEEGVTGLGYTYADKATALSIVERAFPILTKGKARDHHLLTTEIKKKSRNCGNAGVTSMALSAVDTALWDLRAHLLGIPVQELLGRKRESVPFYGSGLFINGSDEDVSHQISYFKSFGMKSFKMKIGSGVDEDLRRVNFVRNLIGEEAELFVDANGAYDTKTALMIAHEISEYQVSWFEEPVTSDDPNGMKFLREHFPPGMNFVAGEYGNQNHDFLSLLQNGLVDIIQADATRAEGVTGTLEASHLASAFNIPFSTHCAPLLHGNIGVAVSGLYIAEGFYDHLRIEEKFFNHSGTYKDGNFFPSPDQRGFGWSLKENIEGYSAYEHVA
ncbi:MAG: enolase C-terminal domain-like protein [Bacteriovoracaceae bacterium]